MSETTQPPTTNIEELKAKTISELTNLAKNLKIQGHSGLKKQDLIFKILQVQIENNGDGDLLLRSGPD